MKTCLTSRIFILLSVFIFSGCSTVDTLTEHELRVSHIVLLWLKDSGNSAHRELLIDASRQLKHIPGVLEVRVGEVIPSNRKIVDDSFDVGIYFSFSSVKAMQGYLTHPLHVKTVKEIILPVTRKVLAYDFLEKIP